jgi:hypothetical protein
MYASADALFYKAHEFFRLGFYQAFYSGAGGATVPPVSHTKGGSA